jgi:hypothetical protein
MYNLPAFIAATSKRDSPIRMMVGAIDTGPINRMRTPIKPENPTTTWNRDDIMMAPWI